jgi:hypothetical protein
MAKITLSGFSKRDIQSAKSVIWLMRLRGVTDVNDCILLLENELTNRKIEPVQNTELCPICKIQMGPVTNKDGLRIIGCKKCRYSKMLGE